MRLLPLSHPVIRRLARPTLAVTPESNRFTPVGAAAVPRTSARDIVSSPFASQIAHFALDSSFFDSHSSPMTRDITELVNEISAMMRDITELVRLISA